jgi:hypothetical protein
MIVIATRTVLKESFSSLVTRMITRTTVPGGIPLHANVKNTRVRVRANMQTVAVNVSI